MLLVWDANKAAPVASPTSIVFEVTVPVANLKNFNHQANPLKHATGATIRQA